MNSVGLDKRESLRIVANQGPQHQDFTTFRFQKQFQKVRHDAGLTGFIAPHNLAFLSNTRDYTASLNCTCVRHAIWKLAIMGRLKV